MQNYKNRAKDSSITKFQIDANQITIEFKNGDQYVYNDIQPGVNHVREMQQLAVLGKGLNAYIKQFVNKNFYQKL